MAPTTNGEKNVAIVKEIVDHAEAVRSRYDLYRSLVFRGIAWRYSDSEYLNVVSLLHMTDNPGREPLQVEWLDNRKLCRFTLQTEPGAISSFLDEMTRHYGYSFGTSERISTKDIRFTLRTIVDAPPEFGDAKFLPSDGGEWAYKTSHGGLQYFLDAHAKLETFQPSEASVKEAGFGNYQQLYREFLFRSFGQVYAGSFPFPTIGVYVVLPNLHASLESVEIGGRSVRASVKTAPNVGLGDFKFVVQAQARMPERYYRSQPYQHQWDPVVESELSYEFPSPPQYAIGRLYWIPGRNESERFVDERNADRTELIHSPQLAVWQGADPEFGVLQKALETRDKQMTFEWGVASLLSLAGFQVNWLGYRESKQPQIRAAADIVVTNANFRQALIAECTLAPGDIAKKISGVSEHSASIAEFLAGWEIKKAVFTTITGPGLVPYEQAAQTAEVALVSREALGELMKAVKSGVPPAQIWESFRSDLHKNPTFG